MPAARGAPLQPRNRRGKAGVMTFVKLKFPLTLNEFVTSRVQLVNGKATLVEARM